MDIIGLHYFVGFISSPIFLATTDILEFKNINNAVVFHCNDYKFSMVLQKAFQSKNVGLQTVHIGLNTSYDMPGNNLKIGMVINTSCNSWESIFLDANNIKYRLSWILQSEELSLVINFLSHYHIKINTDVTILSKNGTKYQLNEIFNTGLNGSPLVNRNIGYWDSSLHIKVERRSDLRGVLLGYVVVVTEDLENETFQHFVENSGSGRFEVDAAHKFKFFTMLTYIRDMYNFSYRLQRTNSWGYERNGSFEGLVGILQRSDADVGGSAVFVRVDRARAVDYVAETWPFKPQFVLRQPKYPGGFYSIYTGPLSTTVWYCVIGILFFTALIMVFALKQKIILAHGDEEDNPNTLTFLFIFSAISQQGIYINRRSNSVKIIVFVTFLFTLTLYQYYTATVVSTLLREPPRVIRTLKDLLQSHLEAGAEDVLYNKDYFKHTTDPVARELYKKKIVTSAHRSYLTPEEGMALVKRGGFAYLVDTFAAYNSMRKTFTEAEICDTQEVALYPPQSMGIVVRKGLPYKEHFAYGIRRMYESGLMRRLQSSWDEPRPPCVRTPNASALSVSLAEFSTALGLLMAGMLAAAFILICEIIMHSRLNKRRMHF